ncbi:hypothetical protein B10403_10790 [Campylobacter jejuni]|nr:hypothetical protein B10403_10790 [Campylobacter jejuni]
MASFKKIFWINVIIVIIVAFNLRAPITAVGPIIDIIKDKYYLNSTVAGILTSLPLIALEVFLLLWGIFLLFVLLFLEFFSFF